MKKTVFCLALLSCTVTLPSCAWQEVGNTEQEETTPLATKEAHEDNIIYLHKYQTRFGSTQEAFKSLIQHGNVVVDYYADWCPPCRRLGDVIKDIAKKYPDIRIVKVNIDKCTEVSTGLGSIPVLVFFKDGREIKRVTGAQTKNELTKLLQTLY